MTNPTSIATPTSIAPIHGAESSDPSFADYWEGACAVRRASSAALVARLAEHGQLRPGLDQQRAADILYAVGSHESFASFTRTCGWSVEEVKAWYYELFCNQLLPDYGRPGGNGAERPTEGLSFDRLVTTADAKAGKQSDPNERPAPGLTLAAMRRHCAGSVAAATP